MKRFLELSERSTVYVLCPSFNKTGGTELAHQLVYEISKIGVKAEIVYYETVNNPMAINDAFKCYVRRFLQMKDVVDSAENVVIAPEIDIARLNSFSNVKKCIWWMSVDNFLKLQNIKVAYQQLGMLSVVKGLLKGRLHWRKPVFEENIIHFYQSEYANAFLKSCGVTKSLRLSDYLNESYFGLDLHTERKNQVLYNPRKGIRFTKKLMKAAPEISWIPLQNMTTDQVKDTLLHSKVYVDFGNHPGKDRFPREAAICGCCVITGKRGSAKYFEDVPISDEFKFDEKNGELERIIKKVQNCLDNYSSEALKFDTYREFIKGEYELFKKDVFYIFGKDLQNSLHENNP